VETTQRTATGPRRTLERCALRQRAWERRCSETGGVAAEPIDGLRLCLRRPSRHRRAPRWASVRESRAERFRSLAPAPTPRRPVPRQSRGEVPTTAGAYGSPRTRAPELRSTTAGAYGSPRTRAPELRSTTARRAASPQTRAPKLGPKGARGPAAAQRRERPDGEPRACGGERRSCRNHQQRLGRARRGTRSVKNLANSTMKRPRWRPT
jgi:hypothetical protein